MAKQDEKTMICQTKRDEGHKTWMWGADSGKTNAIQRKKGQKGWTSLEALQEGRPKDHCLTAHDKDVEVDH